MQWVEGLFPRDKATTDWHLTLTPYSAKVKEILELHLCPLSGVLWPVVALTLPLYVKAGDTSHTHKD
jgi:hypothetical protein